MYVIDLEGNEYALQATSTNEGEVTGNQTFSSTILPTKVNKLFLNNLTEMWNVVDHDDVEHKIVYLRKKGEGKSLTVEIKAIPLFFDTMDRLRAYYDLDEHMTADRAFSRIFDGTGFGFILNGSFAAVQWEGFGKGGDETKLQTFTRALNRYKAEFRIVGRTVYIENQIGRDIQFMYRHRLNASNIIQEIDGSSYFTYAQGYGNYEDSEDGGWENAKLYREYKSTLADIPGIGIRHAPPIKDGRRTDGNELYNDLKTLVDESLKISVSADIHDLRKQGYPVAQSELGDRVFLIDERIGLDDEVRVISQSVTRNYKGDVVDISITFGSEGIAKRHQANIQSAMKNIDDLFAGRTQLPYSVLDDAVKNATRLIQNANTELQFPDQGGILAVDPNNPNYLVAFTSRGIGVSSDGGATFPEAITGLGINASVITAGTMLADRIAGGILAALNGNTIFNLNTGELEMERANFTLGSGARINFTSVGNRIQFRSTDDGTTRSAGFGVGRALNGYPFAYEGTTGAANLDTLSPYFSGAIWNTTRAIADGSSNSINGGRLQLRNKAVDWDKALTFDFTESNPSIYPLAHGSYDFGKPNLRFRRMYVDNILGWRTVYITNPTANRGFAIDTDYVDGHNPSIYGQYPTENNYNIGRSDRYMSFVYTDTLRANNIHGEAHGGSARKLKKNEGIMHLEDSLEFIRNAEIVTFDWRRDERMKFNKDNPQTIYDRQVGFILDDLQMTNDYLIKKDDETIKKDNILFIHQHVIKNLLDRIEKLEGAGQNGTETA